MVGSALLPVDDPQTLVEVPGPALRTVWEREVLGGVTGRQAGEGDVVGGDLLRVVRSRQETASQDPVTAVLSLGLSGTL